MNVWSLLQRTSVAIGTNGHSAATQQRVALERNTIAIDKALAARH
jgi:hypothetical protein